uniref:Bms1-type G domain-containing protein n=1 Tax=Dunaliella tertiolecta TaxID=3047 RepID=A0A7S3QW21_DUNTE
MGGPSGHGQKNKAHKSGNKGLNARDKHKLAREGPRVAAKATGNAAGGKQERMLATKQQRNAKHQELMEKRRRATSSPLVVGLLPLSRDVDLVHVWRSLLAACEMPAPGKAPTQAAASRRHSENGQGDADGQEDVDMECDAGGSSAATHLRAQTVGIAGRPKLRLTLLPPPGPRNDPLAIAEYGRAVEVLLLVTPGGEKATTIDAEGHMALGVLRALGLPETVLAVQGVSSGPGNRAATGSMKERSAARKRAEKAVGAALTGEQRAYPVDSTPDCGQLLRHLIERPAPSLPHWRRQRPALMVEAAEIAPHTQPDPSAAGPSADAPASPLCTLLLSGWVRCAGLRASQLVTIPGAGDFQLERIEGPPEGSAAGGGGTGSGKGGRSERSGTSSGKGGGEGRGDAMDMEGSQPVLLAQAGDDEREPLVRENVPDSDDEGEQTWPTDAEIAEAQQNMFQRRLSKHKVPEGTSAYQAAWIMDSDAEDEDGSEEAGGSEGGADDMMAEGNAGAYSDGEGDEAPDLVDNDDAGTDVMALDQGADEDDEDNDGGGKYARLQEEARAKRVAEGEDAEHPDEMEVPLGVSARVRFQKYKGLKSFRSSPWDPKEWLPKEYSRIFAFENLHRAHKRAREAVERATSGADPLAVEPGNYVRIVVKDVPVDKANQVVARVQASFPSPEAAAAAASSPDQGALPLMVMGLMTHESKMSVMHMSLRKAKDCSESLPNKEQMLFFTGLRSFPARPILSSDTPGDKHKMERWLRAGQQTMASVYAPISYTPLPVLAFKSDPLGGPMQLVAAGAVRSCDPERIVLKKVVLTGYPVRVHKKRATVRFMFHDPDDIRWFKPVEVYTRAGRRGRITEAIGTHGAMKCIFDGPVQQRELVCMNLYKRVYPKWPEGNNLTYA